MTLHGLALEFVLDMDDAFEKHQRKLSLEEMTQYGRDLGTLLRVIDVGDYPNDEFGVVFVFRDASVATATFGYGDAK